MLKVETLTKNPNLTPFLSNSNWVYGSLSSQTEICALQNRRSPMKLRYDTRKQELNANWHGFSWHLCTSMYQFKSASHLHLNWTCFHMTAWRKNSLCFAREYIVKHEIDTPILRFVKRYLHNMQAWGCRKSFWKGDARRVGWKCKKIWNYFAKLSENSSKVHFASAVINSRV